MPEPDPYRRRSGAEGPDTSHRRPAHRDRDRILYSDAFRRLAGVTQVALAAPSLLFHNRLTHSLKVEQVGISLFSKLKDDNGDTFEQLVNRDAIAAACLAHDLGHPPFGHAGEAELHKLVTCRVHREKPRPYKVRQSDPCPNCLLEDGFEGNAQSFRIVSALAVHKGWSIEDADRGYFGLDLTAITLRATTKYPWVRGDGPKPGKWGAYDLDKPLLDEITQGDQAKTVEANIMDWADDISYAVHDLEDFYRSGHLPLELFVRPTDEFDHFFEYVRAQDPGLVADDIRTAIEGLAASQFPSRRFRGEPQEIQKMESLRSDLLTNFIEASSLKDGRLIDVDPFQDRLNALIKQFTWYYVIDNPELTNIQNGQRRVLREIFYELKRQAEDVYLSNGEEVDARAERRLPASLRWFVEVALHQSSDSVKPSRSERIHRALVDYVASLSDEEAYIQHSVLEGREVQGRL